MSIAPIEPHFYALMLETIGITSSIFPAQYEGALADGESTFGRSVSREDS